MRIVGVDVIPSVMRKEDPTWRFALAARRTTEGFVVVARTDGELTGIAYTGAAPHLGAPAERVDADLRRLGAALVGSDADDFDAVDAVPACNPARAGIDLALHDLAAKAAGVPLYRLFGELVRSEVRVLRILAIKRPEEMARIARAHVAEGYRHLKIKLEGDGDADVARVRAIREAVGPDVALTVDANQSYGVEVAIDAVRRMERYSIELVEQPVAADNVEGLAAVARAVETPVDADESAASVDDVRRLVEARAVDSVSLKIPKLGGLRAAREAVALCRATGIRCRVGAHVGSRLLAAAALHFAVATPEVGDVAELGEFERLLDDPAEGLSVERGRLRVPSGVGVGVRLRAAVTA